MTKTDIKIAVVFCGQLRSYDKIAQNLIDNLFCLNPDLYFHVWDIFAYDNGGEPYYPEVPLLGTKMNLELEKQKVYELFGRWIKEFTYENWDEWLTKYSLKNYALTKHLADVKKEVNSRSMNYKNMVGIQSIPDQYDIILKLRSDITFREPFELEDFYPLINQPKRIAVLNGSEYNGCCDWILWGCRSSMFAFSNLFRFMVNLPMVCGPEMILHTWLKQNNLEILKFNKYACLRSGHPFGELDNFKEHVYFDERYVYENS